MYPRTCIMRTRHGRSGVAVGHTHTRPHGDRHRARAHAGLRPRVWIKHQPNRRRAAPPPHAGLGPAGRRTRPPLAPLIHNCAPAGGALQPYRSERQSRPAGSSPALATLRRASRMRTSMKNSEKRGILSHRFLTRGGGVPMGTVHKGPCNATQRRPRRSIPTRHSTVLEELLVIRVHVTAVAFGLRCTRELCVLRSCEDPRPGSARAQSRSRRRRARTSES